MNTDKWVDERMAVLDPGEWRPASGAALGRLRARGRRVTSQRWLMAAGVALGGVLLFTVPAPQACASCVRTTKPETVKSRVVQAEPVAAPFKESGLPTAPIACEVYSDYECPACAELFKATVPGLITDYVRAGKVRLVHRDFPLPQHPHAKLAARYANAAGSLGHYDVVVDQIFRTQAVWKLSGDVDSQVALVLEPEVMQKVRKLVQEDLTLDETVSADVAMAQRDKISQTPTIVIVVNGKRTPIAGFVRLADLKTYLDELLRP